MERFLVWKRLNVLTTPFEMPDHPPVSRMPVCLTMKMTPRVLEVIAGFRENSGFFPGGRMRVRFGECVLDSETRELLVAGKTVHLTPKAFDLLAILIENRPRALSKTEIHEKLWPDTFVADGTLTSLLAEVRSAIRDEEHEKHLIRTVHRFGYAFSGSAETEAAAGPRAIPRAAFAYRLYWRSREFALEEGENVLGRDPRASIFLDDASVSRRHARIVTSGGGALIEDLRSKNGTFVRGAAIEAPSRIADGDEIRLGSVPLTFRVFPLSGSTETTGGR
jgi:DNA-binding winged helix-turn-helix (wHTH) protein